MSSPYDSSEYRRNRKAVTGLPCARCHADPPSTADHIIPVSRGGTHDVDNLRPLCRRCNSALGGHLNKGKRRLARRRRINRAY